MGQQYPMTFKFQTAGSICSEGTLDSCLIAGFIQKKQSVFLIWAASFAHSEKLFKIMA